MLRKSLVLVMLLLAVSLLNAQIEFVSSYFVTNEGDTVECLIKDVEWNKNPTSFEYKTDENGDVQMLTIEEVREFKVESSKYQRYDVDIDFSREEITALSRQKSPVFEHKTLFLKVLLEGDKSLFYYNSGEVNRYFIQTDNKVEQLIYKSFKNEDGDVAKNEKYRGQLLVYLGHDDKLRDKISHSNYNEKDLTGVFELYHEINCNECVVYQEEKFRTMYFSIKPGLELATLKTTTADWKDGLDLGLRSSFTFGFELEYVLNFNQGKWTVFIEPTIYRDQEMNYGYQSQSGTVYADYQLNMLRIPVGARYYMFLSEDRRLFFDASIAAPIRWDSYLKYYSIASGGVVNNHADLEFETVVPNFSVSIGYNYKSWAAQLRYNGVNQDLAGDDTGYLASYNGVAIVMAYKFQFSNRTKEQ